MPENVTTKQRDLQKIEESVKKLAAHHSRTVTFETELFTKKVSVEKWTLPNLGAPEDSIVERFEQLAKLGPLAQRTNGDADFVPLPFDLLLLIFSTTDEKFRQRHFHRLIECYFENLRLERPISREDFLAQVNAALLPAKLEVASKLDANSNELLDNIASDLKFVRLSREDIYEIVRNKFGTSDYRLISYDISKLSEQNGHLGQYFRLKASVEVEGQEHQIQLFVKLLIQVNNTLKTLAEAGSKKEEFFYQTLMEDFKRYGLDSIITFAPKCYLSRVHDLLVLDDMTERGFVGFNPSVTLTYGELSLLVQQLARFHASFLIMEEMMSEKQGKPVRLIDLYGDYLSDEDMDFFKDSEIYRANTDSINYCIELFPQVVQQRMSLDEFKAKATKMYEVNLKKYKDTKNFRRTILHGDMYVGNTLVKFNENGQPVEASLIDFQLLKYNLPTEDLLILLYINSSKNTRDQYMDKLLEEYYEELSRCLTEFGFDINKVYSPEDFEGAVKYLKSLAFCHAMMYNHYTKAPPELRKEVFKNDEAFRYHLIENKRNFIDMAMVSSDYKTLQEDMIRDFYDICLSDDYC